MIKAIESGRPDLILHLGDGGRDLDGIRSRFPGIKLEAVCGNCDLSSGLPEVLDLTVCGVRLFLTHGHLYGVKSNLNRLLYAAEERGAQAVLFGHTHRALVTEAGGLTVINPGSCGYPPRTYAELTFETDGRFSAAIIDL